jgi:hypothetical protein
MRRLAPILALAVAASLASLTACGDEIDAGGERVDAGTGDDPLAVDEDPEPGSLDQLHRDIVARRCSGQPGLCHNGQFEPNLSTPALFYDYVVRRPALEKPDRLRVDPGDPDASFIIDKLRNRDVSTQMPLGAEPLADEEIQLIEDWIRDGALRRPDAEPAPVLNNPPREPEIAVFNAAGERLDTGGPFTVAAGTQLTLRHSVSDFETSDEEIAFGAFVLQLTDGRQLALAPGGDDPEVGASVHDPDGPMGNGDLLNRTLSLTIGPNVELVVDESGTTETVPSVGLVFTIVVAYVDDAEDGIAAIAFSPATLEVE